VVAREGEPIVKPLIIAEAGVNHNGELGLARQLVDSAADAGADLVKFQTFRAEKLTTSSAMKAEYQGRTTEAGESQRDMLRRLELTREMHEDLLVHCRSRGIEFFSTGFDESSFDLLVELGLDHFKISSGDLTNLPYLRHVGRHGKPLILSTGMATLEEVANALEALERAGTPRKLITVLHCNTEYPTPMRDVNLRAMVTMGAALDVAFGYSDHTLGIEVPIAAVALGASVIEKHLTLDRRLPGPDQATSLEPAEFKSMVLAIRNIEQALGDGIKRPSVSEAKNLPVVRKSLVAACTIRKGDVFSDLNLAVKRPGTGLSPMLWDDILGRKAARDFEPDDLIVL
jgi:N,N'-diacetyllegionaminate synthase